ncbi:hypothetical protein VTK73DRAFT_2980 [Phialemonium thermophilum]|uniref:SMP-30/Gluconolactonase/LRE-like region domain-containing protein n=1 Tax=Phialemonium thermophilum TaxID=223376 RepID=A0ABR3Y2C0_9PEZI
MTDFGYGNPLPEGSLLRFDLGKTKETLRTGLVIPNSIGWSPDYKTLYFTHTTENIVHAFDYDLGDGSISNERIFYKHDGSGGLDGFRVDIDGNIWHAIYGEGRVIKISPQGKVVGQINLPTRNITCPEFVGTVLYITTAADDEGEGDSKRYGGGLYRVDVGVTGVAPHKFKLDA